MDISQEHVNADGMNIVEQIHEEIRLLKLVGGHKYIIRLEAVFESPAFLFLVFELCTNYDLFEYLSANVSLSEKRCRAIMKEVFEAVHHCHKVGGVVKHHLQLLKSFFYSHAEKSTASRYKTRKHPARQTLQHQADRFRFG